MAEFKRVMNDKKRMCEMYISNCKTCPLNSDNNGTNLKCEDFFRENPEKAEKIIEDWTNKNPVITNADKFKEVFGVEPREFCFGNRDNLTYNICGGHCKDCPHYKDAEYHAPEKTKNI
jgi:hypothetical protein